MIAQARVWARSLKREVRALALAYTDPRTPWYARVAAAAVIGYALSPIDLIPDFIPVLGLLDDLLLLPLGIALALRLIPPQVLAEARTAAATAPPLRPSRAGAAAIVTLWIVGLGAAVWWWLR